MMAVRTIHRPCYSIAPDRWRRPPPDRHAGGAEKRIVVMVRNIAWRCLPLIIGCLISGAPRSDPAPAAVNLIMVDYDFIPHQLTFKRGMRYRLHMENHGKETHELTAPTFFAIAQIDNPAVLNADRSEIVMQPGESKDLFLTARGSGTYDLRCADHDWAGMVGGITVE